MAYDPIKAHEYYMKYRKKGLLKGRKKGKAKTSKKSTKKTSTKKQSLLGLSTAGLNDTGKMQWAMAKDNLTKQMNTALAKATTDEEKQKIRSDYQNKALAELQKIKADPSMAQAKKASTKGSAGKSSSKGSSGGSSGGTSKSTNTAKSATKGKVSSSNGKMLRSYAPKSGGSSSGTKQTGLTEEQKQIREQMVQSANEMVSSIRERMRDMSTSEKAEAKKTLRTIADELRKRIRKV